MDILDILNSDPFKLIGLSARLINRPKLPSFLGDRGLFTSKGIKTTIVSIEEKTGQLTLIQSSPRGAPSTDAITRNLRTLRTFKVPHYEREGYIPADEIQDVRMFGDVDAAGPSLESVQSVVDERLAELRLMHDANLEYQRACAVQGMVLDADGSTIFNLFTEMGVSQQTSSWDLDNTAFDPRGEGMSVARQVEQVLGAAPYRGLVGLCSPGFFDDLTGNAKVLDAFRFQQGLAVQALGGDLRRTGFNYAGITWFEPPAYYINKPGVKGMPDPDDTDNTVKLIADGDAYVYPEGTTLPEGSLFQTYFAPADLWDAANKVGAPMYAMLDMGGSISKGVKIHTQSNPLSLCLRPRAVIKCSST